MQTELPKISVITVCLNAIQFIENSICSVLAQRYNNIDYLIIDGGSNDGTIEVLQKYQQQGKLKYISENDDGIYHAMNKGVALASGDWIYFLGSDDVFFDNGVLERIFNESHLDFDIIYGNVRFLYSGTIYDGEFDHEKISFKNICHQALFVRKTVFDRIGFFNTNYSMCADYEFNLRWMGLNMSHKYIPETVALYNEKGLSGQVWDQLFDSNFHQLLIDNNIFCRRAFLALKQKYATVRYSFTFKIGKCLVGPFSWVKNKIRFFNK